MSLPFGERANPNAGVQPKMWDTLGPWGEGVSRDHVLITVRVFKRRSAPRREGGDLSGWVRGRLLATLQKNLTQEVKFQISILLSQANCYADKGNRKKDNGPLTPDH
jgi:hypothetical protein